LVWAPLVRERQRVAEILVGDADRAVDLRDVLRMAVAEHFKDRRRVGRRIDGRHVVGAGDGDHQVPGADIAVAVIDLGHVGQRQRVARPQPVEVGRRRVKYSDRTSSWPSLERIRSTPDRLKSALKSSCASGTIIASEEHAQRAGK